MWRIPPVGKELYLTFDDGPVPGPTDFVLEQLARVRIKATFFCIGDNIRKHRNVFQQITRHGHAVGNHTFHHLKGWKTTTQDYVKDVMLCTDEIGTADPAAKPTTLFRPPYGRITREQISSLKNHTIVMWDVLTNDYAKGLSPEGCLRGSLAATRPGSIIVFHDSLKAEKKMRYALPRYLDHFIEKGFTFKLLP